MLFYNILFILFFYNFIKYILCIIKILIVLSECIEREKKMLWCCIWMENNKLNYGKCFLGFSVLIMFVLWCGKDW